MEKVHITKVNYTDKKKDGTPIVNSYGKPSYKTGIQTKEYGEEWINGFLPFVPDKWEGTEQEVEISEDPKWGKQFKLPPKKNAGLSDADKAALKIASEEAYAARVGVQKLYRLVEEFMTELRDAGITVAKNSDGSPVPNFNKPVVDDSELASLEEAAAAM